MANFWQVLVPILACFVAIWTGLGWCQMAADVPCPCSEASHCKPIATKPQKEVFAFWVGSTAWKHFDWTKITTIVMFHRHDQELMCFAHAIGARVVSMGIFPAANLTSAADRKAWIAARVEQNTQEHLDGINIDIEYPLTAKEAPLLTTFVAQTKAAFHVANPNYQVTFDVAWSPDCIDDRCYDYKGIAMACDFVFVMAYSEQSQIYGPCIAMANSPYNKTVKGIQAYLKLGIPPDKLVLGVAWDGVDYVCQQLSKDNVCSIERVPFHGAPCSDLPAREREYSFIMSTLIQSTTGRLYNSTYNAPYFNYKGDIEGQIRQIWYDDVESLTLRYKYAKAVKLHGVGMWDADSLNYTQEATAEKQTLAMWEAINAFLH